MSPMSRPLLGHSQSSYGGPTQTQEHLLRQFGAGREPMRRPASAAHVSHAHSFSAVTDHERDVIPQTHRHDSGHSQRRSGPFQSQRTSLNPNVNWMDHRRRESTDSTWSQHSGASTDRDQSNPTPPRNSLQFQPLPHAHSTSYSRSGGGLASQSSPSSSEEIQSPFGVLIADIEGPGVSATDPQRLAILRTLRASGSQGPFSQSLNDPSGQNLFSSARYECSYCSKRFNRPSSLRVCQSWSIQLFYLMQATNQIFRSI